MNDLRFALRGLRSAPGFTAIAVLTLGLGIGANATVFSLVNANYFRPLGFRDVDRLVDVHEESATRLCAGCGVGTSYPGLEDWRREAQSFEAMAGYSEAPFSLSGDGEPERVGGAIASHDLFAVLGVPPILGRSFAPEDDRVGVPGVVLLGHELWQRRYGGDSSVVGRSVRINGEPHTVIGVMPPRFKFPEFSDLWVPLVPHAYGRSRAERDIGVVARLKFGVPVAQADAEMRTIARGLEREHPAEQAEWSGV